MGFIKRYTTSFLVFTLLVLCVNYALFEWRNSQNRNLDYPVLAKQSVQNATEQFNEFLFEFTSASTEYATSIETSINSNNDSFPIEDSKFWGTTTFKKGAPIYWSGFSNLTLLDTTQAESLQLEVAVSRVNNVQFLYSMIPFTVVSANDTTIYHVLTTRKISQENILAVGERLELDPNQLFIPKNQFPIRFSIEHPESESILAIQPVSTISSENAGFFYALEENIHSFWKTNTQESQSIRAGFLLAILLTLGIYFAWVSRQLPALIQLIIQLTVYALLYFGFQLINQFSIGLLSKILQIPAFDLIIRFGFVYLITASIHVYIRKQHSLSSSKFKSSQLIWGFLCGIILAMLYHFFYSLIHHYLVEESIGFLSDAFASDWQSSLLVLIASAIFYMLLVLNINVLKTLTMHNRKIQPVPFSVNLLAFFFSLLTLWFVSNNKPHSFSITATSIGSYLIALAWLSYLFRYKRIRVQPSSFRFFLILNLIFSSIFFYLITITYSNHIQEKMIHAVEIFGDETEEEITPIIRQLLSDLHFELTDQPLNNIDARVQSAIAPEWLRYSISVQLIDTTGALISDYTTNLSAPQWSTDFQINELIIPFVGERIRRENLRPVIRTQPINIINAEYTSFRRGWIPLYEDVGSDRISAWVLASVYTELPDPSRPLRTVITSSSPQDFDFTISLVEYENRLPTKNAIYGTPFTVPDYRILPEEILEFIQSDSISFRTSEIESQTITELFIKSDGESVIRAAVSQPNLNEQLFSFLQIYFLVLVVILIFTVLASVFKIRKVFNESRQFKDRLIDRFLLASFLCLFALVGITFFILDQQNSNQVQDELTTRLDIFVENIAFNDSTDFTDAEFLKTNTDFLAEDVALYVDAGLVNSTTPQIYTQHLLPSVLPWNVYRNIKENGSRREIEIVTLNGLDMMIGYQPWINDNEEIVGIAAIPTFLRTPKFYDELLSTTSYLVVFFSLIFGALMISVGLIASRMSAPLEALNKGLKKISAGDLNSKIPVTSNDEIGVLTKAYNTMAARLKELQQELAQSEREAAWKEMAQQVAHEIKNPLTPMKLNLQHLERQLEETGGQLSEDNPRIASITKSMIDQIEALNKIASDFSKFAKPLQQEFDVFNLNELVESTANLYSQENTLRVKLASRKLLIDGVADELRRALVNLIKNAQEATSEGGLIDLKTEADASQHFALVHVSDSGKGIPKEDHNRIFTPNFSTKTSGTGLGLAITKKIIEEHQGTISFNSRKGKGTTFTIKIPLKRK